MIDESTTGAPEESENPKLPDVPSLVATCINLFAAKAWETMGLVPDPQTKQIERKLDDAQLAIDAASALGELMRSRVSETERREIETLLANLRINFVEQKQKA
jgi:uncharacterized protein DUF1844